MAQYRGAFKSASNPNLQVRIALKVPLKQQLNQIQRKKPHNKNHTNLEPSSPQGRNTEDTTKYFSQFLNPPTHKHRYSINSHQQHKQRRSRGNPAHRQQNQGSGHRSIKLMFFTRKKRLSFFQSIQQNSTSPSNLELIFTI